MLSAVILCGGAGSRMGRSKAELELAQNRTFLDALLDTLDDCPELLLADGSGKTEARPGVRAVADLFPGCGPMAGLHAALLACRFETLLCVPCDVPLFPKGLGGQLCRSLRPEQDALVLSTSDGRIHPFCGVYRKRTAEALERRLRLGRLRMTDALMELNAAVVPVGSFGWPDLVLQNVNTPEDHRRLLENAGKEGEGCV